MAAVGDDCLFCRIVAGEIPADVVARDRRTPWRSATSTRRRRSTCSSSRACTSRTPRSWPIAAPETVAELVGLGRQVAADEGHDSYRLVFNTGADAGQTVFHAHLHVLAGRSMAWPPG